MTLSCNFYQPERAAGPPLLKPANVADNSNQVREFLFKGLKGKCYEDRGYLSSLLEELLKKNGCT